MKINFFETTREIDRLMVLAAPSQKDQEKLINILFGGEQYQKYFFCNCANYFWFDVTKVKELVARIPSPIKREEDDSKSFPAWWPGVYLVRIAEKIPSKVTEFLKGIKTDNILALNSAMEVILKLPLAYAKQLISNIGDWLETEYAASSLIDKYVLDLMKKFASANEIDALFEMFKIVSQPQKGKKAKDKLQMDIYHYKKDVFGEIFTVLIKTKCEEVISLLEQNLKKAIFAETKDVKEDFSTVWRSSIENSSQNYQFDEIRDIFAQMLRDAMVEFYGQDEIEVKSLIKKYLHEEYSIFRRLAVHVVRSCGLDDFVPGILLNQNNLDDHSIYHEFYLLVREKFAILGEKDKNSFIDWIIAGPEGEKDDDYRKYWISRRLSMVNDYILNDQKLEQYRLTLKTYEDEINKEKDPDFLAVKSGWVGPESPIDKEALGSKSPERLVHYLKEEFKPTGRRWSPTPEGVARLFMDIVKEKPDIYAAIADNFYWEGIYPTYVSNLFRGLEEAWKAGKTFEWKKIISLCKKVMEMKDDPEIEGKRDKFDYGSYEYVRGAMSELMATSVKKHSHPIPDEYLKDVKEILFYIIDNDPDPSPEDEKEYGKGNQDYVSYAINCNRGKATEALILYALKFASLHEDKEKNKDKGPFPPGERLEPDVKAFLAKRLERETSPSVHSVFGKFFPHLNYLDQKWVRQEVSDGHLFPLTEDKSDFWEADWEGYLFFNSVYNDLYKLLENHYRKAIDLSGKERAGRRSDKITEDRLADHIMTAFWRKKEEITNEKGLMVEFFKKANIETRQHALWFLASAIKNPEFNKDDWKRFRELWEYRVANAKDDELVGFFGWLEYSDKYESIDTLLNLLKPIISVVSEPYHHDLMDYLLASVDDHPVEVMGLLFEVLKTISRWPSLYVDLEEICTIIQKARENPAAKDFVNDSLNILGENGYYGFREIKFQDLLVN